MSHVPTAIVVSFCSLIACGLLSPLGAADVLEQRANVRPSGKVPPPPPKVEDLGDGRYRVGPINVDKAKRHFTVQGTVLRRTPPLEFLAVTKGGYKAYESLLELDASAHEFNLACILIGLDAQKAKPARQHFDRDPVLGDAVDLSVSWRLNGKTTQADAADLIQMAGKTLPRHQWVYTGSVVMPEGQYLAHIDGTVIGFVHDPASIIEHHSGLIDAYDAVTGNQALVPPIGTRVTLSVRPARPE